MKNRATVLDLVDDEIFDQDKKWGSNRTHPDVHEDAIIPSVYHMGWNSDIFKKTTDHRALTGTLSWADILLEEVAEALDEDDTQKRIVELVQVAAVAVQWVNDLMLRDAAA